MGQYTYRSKVVEIEAWHWLFRPDQQKEPDWLTDALTVEGIGRVNFEPDHAEGPRMSIYTPEGVMVATPGDWIIKGLEGELYPCKDSVFQKKYEEADDD
jgi:hypothetical protein